MSYDPNLAFLQTENSNLYWQDIQNSRERGQLKAQISQIQAYYEAELLKANADHRLLIAQYNELAATREADLAAKDLLLSKNKLALITKDKELIAKDEELIAKDEELIAKDEAMMHAQDDLLHTEIDRRCAKMSSYDYSEQLKAVLDSLNEELPPETVNQVVNKAQLKFFKKVAEVGHRYGNGVDLGNPNRFKIYGYEDKLKVPDWVDDAIWEQLSDTMDGQHLAIEINNQSLFHYTTDDPLLQAEFEALTGQSLKSTSSNVAELLTSEAPVAEPAKPDTQNAWETIDPFAPRPNPAKAEPVKPDTQNAWDAIDPFAPRQNPAKVEPAKSDSEKPKDWADIDPFAGYK
jgi:hypothetical protein